MPNEACFNPKNCTMIKKEHLTLNEVVQCYKKRRLKCLHKEIQYYIDKSNQYKFDKFIYHVGDKLHPHQKRITCCATQNALDILSKLEDVLKYTNNFKELHDILNSSLRNISGIGELYIYDAALHIGVSRNYFPQNIYVQCGSKEGAEKLHIFKNMIRRDEFIKIYPAFEPFEPYEIENILCWCRKTFSPFVVLAAKSCVV